MNLGHIVFLQMMDSLPVREFRECVDRVSRELQGSDAFTYGAGFYACDSPSPNTVEVSGTTVQQ